jgi:hypothetical protein
MDGAAAAYRDVLAAVPKGLSHADITLALDQMRARAQSVQLRKAWHRPQS